ncbi:hypothetical protein [Citrobacter braakii]|uniref:hypothetical protein n=1 Tax=Citrobacter braakii TaxID=57706 RepID=UPI000CDDB063|nr:hypothetical protein [Citrobacter braakii]POT29232.1 hypothetical protein C3423_24480 [Citrobacter braakii]POT34091.1 hypothetical protein C3431_24300 [Citrobacter braakii]POT38916.1 hypothetical protein C3425_24315 [Citrobacter braakii]POU80459.1 hypothetical protein C3426_24335 [Citrobacter braakii]POV06435.1 hypothetical protein C3427_24530 [Citrobacter braakii]
MKGVKSVWSLLIGAIVLSVVAGSIMLFYVHHRNLLNFSCSAPLHQVNSDDDFSLHMAFILTMQPNSHGLAVMDGNIVYKNTKYKLRRDLEFSYEPFSDRLYKVSDLKVIKGAKDSVPEALLPMNYSFLYIARVKNVNNALLVGAVTFPAFMCLTG